MALPPTIAVIVPCYGVKNQVLSVLERMGPEVTRIYCVDDACPEGSGRWIQEQCKDPRVSVLFNPTQSGVGGATLHGYRQALKDEAEILVKCDGDGQMDPSQIPALIAPLQQGTADYSKGNRFYRLDFLMGMPMLRIMGNAFLSFFSKLSTGYWGLFDPTNGFTALHAVAARELPLDKISQGYFFESDLLFRLNILQAVAVDIPLRAHYGKEQSHLRIHQAAPEFLIKHITNAMKRLFYSYFLRNFNVASLCLLLGIPLFSFGFIFGVWKWVHLVQLGIVATAGTVMLAALPFLLGCQFLLVFISFDMAHAPVQPLQQRLLRQTQ